MKYKVLAIVIIFTLIGNNLLSQVNSIVWQQCYGTASGNNQDWIQSTVRFNNGYLLGISIGKDEPWISNYHGSADYWLVYTDSIGNIIWERCYGGSKGDGPEKIIPIDSNYIYLYGGTESIDGDSHNLTNEFYDNWVLKINKSGEIIWENCYGGPRVDETRDAILTPDGGLIIMSRITSAGGDITEHFGNVDIWLCKIDSLGNIQWEKTLGNHGKENAITMEYATDSTFFVLAGVNESGGMVDCECNEHPMGHLDVWLVELDLNGNIINQACYGGTGNEIISDIVKIEDGYVFAAKTTSNDGDVSGLHGIPWSLSTPDIWVCKIDFSDKIIWQTCLGGSDAEWPEYITSTQDSGFIVIGNTSSYDENVNTNHNTNFSTYDVWVVKLNHNGEIEWEQCYGGLGNEKLGNSHSIVKNDDYNFLLGIQTLGISCDIECELYTAIGEISPDAWLINIKDCNHYAPAQPLQPTGKDTLCVNTDSITTYTTTPATFAWYYEWELQPEEAGTIEGDSLITTIHWNPNHEGPATFKVRSSNDCGESTWSDSLVIQTYMCLGAEENTIASNLRVYPNPATNTLIVELETHTQQPSSLEIYNSTGAMVYSAQTTNTKTTVDVSSWSNGIYVIKIINTGAQADACASYSRKVVVR